MPRQMRLVVGAKGRGARAQSAPRRKAARRSRRRPTILMILALAALIAGFLVRRLMLPEAVHYLAYRPPDHPVGPPETVSRPAPASDTTGVEAAPSAANGGENLSDSDRRQLESVLRQKAK
jgi:hypothetical protein